jgi:hypothetical protein
VFNSDVNKLQANSSRNVGKDNIIFDLREDLMWLIFIFFSIPNELIDQGKSERNIKENVLCAPLIPYGCIDLGGRNLSQQEMITRTERAISSI